MSKFIQADPNQPLLLPPDLRDWAPEDDLAHSVLEAVNRVSMIALWFVSIRNFGFDRSSTGHESS